MKRRRKVEKSAFLNEHHGSCLFVFFCVFVANIEQEEQHVDVSDSK